MVRQAHHDTSHHDMMTTKTIHVPGSKSLTNRALLLAALAKGESVLDNVLDSDDTRVMMEALSNLGLVIEKQGNQVKIQGNPHWEKPKTPLYLSNAGTAVRFLTAILANQPFETTLDGDSRMRERPLHDLLAALRNLGTDIDCPTGCPPLVIHGKPLTQNKTHLSGTTSSQYVSALLMLAPLLPNGLTITIDGELTSKPYIDLTLDLMNTFCIQEIERDHYRKFHVPPQSYRPQNLTIEADASSATYFWGIAALTGQTITTPHLTRNSKQADIQILPFLEQMGCNISEDKNGIMVKGPLRLSLPTTDYGLRTFFINANAFPDGAMTLAILAAFAQGETVLTGLHTLKHKESDRLTALATELQKIGAHATATDDTLTIEGNPACPTGNPDSLHPVSIATYNDHRMAMSFGMAQCRLPEITIENPGCVAKTYPHFWEDLKKALA